MRTYRFLVVVALALAGACAGRNTERVRVPGDPLAETPAATLFQRGVELRRSGDYVRAEQYLAAARDRGHDASAVVYELVGVCIDAARYRAALRYAVPHLERNPDDWALRYLVASLYLAVGETPRARDELERVVADRPDEPEPRFLLAIVWADYLQQPGAAAAHLEAYLALAPDGRHAAEARARLHRPEQVTR